MADRTNLDTAITVHTLHDVTLDAREGAGPDEMITTIEAGGRAVSLPALTRSEAEEYGRALYHLALFLMGWSSGHRLAVPLPVANRRPAPTTAPWLN